MPAPPRLAVAPIARNLSSVASNPNLPRTLDIEGLILHLLSELSCSPGMVIPAQVPLTLVRAPQIPRLATRSTSLRVPPFRYTATLP
jgi:hypothetical protein